VHRRDGRGEVLGGVVEVEDRRPLRERVAELPVVVARVGDLAETQVRPLRQDVREIAAERVLERELLGLGRAAEADGTRDCKPRRQRELVVARSCSDAEPPDEYDEADGFAGQARRTGVLTVPSIPGEVMNT